MQHFLNPIYYHVPNARHSNGINWQVSPYAKQLIDNAMLSKYMEIFNTIVRLDNSERYDELIKWMFHHPIGEFYYYFVLFLTQNPQFTIDFNHIFGPLSRNQSLLDVSIRCYTIIHIILLVHNDTSLLAPLPPTTQPIHQLATTHDTNNITVSSSNNNIIGQQQDEYRFEKEIKNEYNIRNTYRQYWDEPTLTQHDSNLIYDTNPTYIIEILPQIISHSSLHTVKFFINKLENEWTNVYHVDYNNGNGEKNNKNDNKTNAHSTLETIPHLFSTLYHTIITTTNHYNNIHFILTHFPRLGEFVQLCLENDLRELDIDRGIVASVSPRITGIPNPIIPTIESIYILSHLHSIPVPLSIINHVVLQQHSVLRLFNNNRIGSKIIKWLFLDTCFGHDNYKSFRNNMLQTFSVNTIPYLIYFTSLSLPNSYKIISNITTADNHYHHHYIDPTATISDDNNNQQNKIQTRFSNDIDNDDDQTETETNHNENPNDIQTTIINSYTMTNNIKFKFTMADLISKAHNLTPSILRWCFQYDPSLLRHINHVNKDHNPYIYQVPRRLLDYSVLVGNISVAKMLMDEYSAGFTLNDIGVIRFILRTIGNISITNHNIYNKSIGMYCHSNELVLSHQFNSIADYNGVFTHNNTMNLIQNHDSDDDGIKNNKNNGTSSTNNNNENDTNNNNTSNNNDFQDYQQYQSRQYQYNQFVCNFYIEQLLSKLSMLSQQELMKIVQLNWQNVPNPEEKTSLSTPSTTTTTTTSTIPTFITPFNILEYCFNGIKEDDESLLVSIYQSSPQRSQKNKKKQKYTKTSTTESMREAYMNLHTTNYFHRILIRFGANPLKLYPVLSSSYDDSQHNHGQMLSSNHIIDKYHPISFYCRPNMTGFEHEHGMGGIDYHIALAEICEGLVELLLDNIEHDWMKTHVVNYERKPI